MKYVYLILMCALLCACEREVPAVSDDGTRAVNDTVSSSGGGVSITVENNGEWGGIIEQ